MLAYVAQARENIVRDGRPEYSAFREAVDEARHQIRQLLRRPPTPS